MLIHSKLLKCQTLWNTCEVVGPLTWLLPSILLLQMEIFQIKIHCINKTLQAELLINMNRHYFRLDILWNHMQWIHNLLVSDLEGFQDLWGQTKLVTASTWMVNNLLRYKGSKMCIALTKALSSRLVLLALPILATYYKLFYSM